MRKTKFSRLRPRPFLPPSPYGLNDPESNYLDVVNECVKSHFPILCHFHNMYNTESLEPVGTLPTVSPYNCTDDSRLLRDPPSIRKENTGHCPWRRHSPEQLVRRGLHFSDDDEPTTPVTELFLCVQRCDRRRMNPCRSQAPVRRMKLFLAACQLRHYRCSDPCRPSQLHLPDIHAPYVFLKATRASVMACPTRQRGISFPHHRDRSHHARASSLNPRTKDFII